MNKKAALELSINAIVIIVIAMAVLGLGLGFVRSQIKKMTETTSSVQDTVKEQILNDLRTGDKKLSLQSSEITIGKGESIVLGFGIKNMLNEKLTFGINISKVSGIPDMTLQYDNRALQYSLSATESDVFSARLTAPTVSGTSIYEVAVNGKTAQESAASTYATKTFFVTVIG